MSVRILSLYIPMTLILSNTFVFVFISSAESLKITEDLLRNHTLPPIFVKQYTTDGDFATSQKNKNTSADMLQVSRMAAQYCVGFDERIKFFNSDSDDVPDEYLNYDNPCTIVPDLSANIAISLCRHRKKRLDAIAASTDKMDIDANDDEDAINMATLAQRLDSQALSMFGY